MLEKAIKSCSSLTLLALVTVLGGLLKCVQEACQVRNSILNWLPDFYAPLFLYSRLPFDIIFINYY